MSSSSSITLSAMHHFASKELSTYLSSLPFPVTRLILHHSLIAPLQLHFSSQDLEAYEVHRFSMDLKLRDLLDFERDSLGIGTVQQQGISNNLSGTSPGCVFFLRNHVEHVQTFAKWMKDQLLHLKCPNPPHYAICITPKRSMLLEKILEHHGVISSGGTIAGVPLMGEMRSLCVLPLEAGETQQWQMAAKGQQGNIANNTMQALATKPFESSSHSNAKKRHIFTMGLSHVYKDMCLNHDYTCLADVARVLSEWSIGNTSAPPQQYEARETYVGHWSKNVYHLLRRMRDNVMDNQVERHQHHSSNTESSQHMLTESLNYQVDELILFDRNMDLLSPFISSFSYESLIDNIYGIEYNLFDFSKIDTQNFSGDHKVRKMLLNDSDEIFHNIRTEHIATVGRVLNRYAREIRSIVDKKNSIREVRELKNFVKDDLPHVQRRKRLLSLHIDIAQSINKHTSDILFEKWRQTEEGILLGNNTQKQILDFIHERIVHKDHLSLVFKLIVLNNMVNQGYSVKQFNFIQKEMIHTYGHQIMLTIHNLRKVGLFCTVEEFPQRQQAMSHMPLYGKNLTKTFKMFPEHNENGNTQHDLSAIFSGYVPLSIRIIEQQLVDSQKLRDVLGSGGNVSQFYGTKVHQRASKSLRTSGSTQKKRVLVFFVGGVTRAEMNCLQVLEDRLECEFIIGSTNIVRGSKLIGSLFHESGNQGVHR